MQRSARPNPSGKNRTASRNRNSIRLKETKMNTGNGGEESVDNSVDRNPSSAEKTTDMRWTDKDTIKQLKALSDLHEKTLEWMKVKKNEQIEKFRTEGRQLDRKTEDIRVLLRDIMRGDVVEVKDILKENKEAWLLCKDQPPEGIIEGLSHLIFLQRRELDKLNYELRKTNKTYYETRLEEKMMVTGIAEEEQIENIRLRIQEIATEIEQVRTQTKAAQLVEKAYDKLRRILKKESLIIDQLLDGLKTDILVQSECILKAMETGQTAVEDKANFIGQFKGEVSAAKVEETSHDNEIKQLKLQIARVKKMIRTLPRTDSTYKMDFAAGEEKQKYLNTLKENVKEREEQFKLLMNVTNTNTHGKVFPKIEQVMKDRFGLLRKLEVCQVWKNTEIQRQKYMEYTLKALGDQEIILFKEYIRRKKELESKITDYKDDVDKLKKQIWQLSRDIFHLKRKVYHFDGLLNDIKIGDPGPPLNETVDDDDDDEASRTNMTATEEDSESEHTESDVAAKFLEKNIDAAHKVDVVTLKLRLIFKDFKNYLADKRDQFLAQGDGCRFEFSMEDDEEVGEIEEADRGKEDALGSLLEMVEGEAGGVLEVEDEEEKLYRREPPTRLEMKYKSQRIVDANENEPQQTQVAIRVKKHVCY